MLPGSEGLTSQARKEAEPDAGGGGLYSAHQKKKNNNKVLTCHNSSCTRMTPRRHAWTKRGRVFCRGTTERGCRPHRSKTFWRLGIFIPTDHIYPFWSKVLRGHRVIHEGFSSASSVSGAWKMCQPCKKLVQAQTYLDYLSSRLEKMYQNMRAHHPFCLGSNLTVTDRPWADDRWPNVEEKQKNSNFTLKLFHV